jgi:hypothetical protein
VNRIDGLRRAAALFALTLWPLACLAAAPGDDLCDRLPLPLIAATLSDDFDTPVRSHTPAGDYRGEIASCTYTGKTLTFEIRKWQYPSAMSWDRNLQSVRALFTTGERATPLHTLGQNAWVADDMVIVLQDMNEYRLLVYPTASASYHVDRKDKLAELAQRFFGSG